MSQFLRSATLSFALSWGGVGALQAQVAPTDDLLDLLGMGDSIAIMRVEGLNYAAELATDMLPGTPGPDWTHALEHIYDPQRMAAIVRGGFAQSYLVNGMNTDGLERFFSSDLGREIIGLEISARQAMSDPAIEAAVREAYLERADNSAAEDPRLAQIEEYVQVGDLIEANVVGGLNTSIRFYQGLVEGGAIEMSEAEILADVWDSEDSTRRDTREWIFGFLLMAYRPLSDAELEAYTAVMASPEGRAMTRALFAGFDEMYGDISYLLGRAIAFELRSQTL